MVSSIHGCAKQFLANTKFGQSDWVTCNSVDRIFSETLIFCNIFTNLLDEPASVWLNHLNLLPLIACLIEFTAIQPC